MAKYRIVRDNFAGFEVQIWRWWRPVWVQPRINTHCRVRDAEAYALSHATGGATVGVRAPRGAVVKNLGVLR